MRKRKVRSWHGLEFTIEILNGWAKIGFFLHPQVANFFLRRGLPEKERIEMEILHEFGHVQTFPFVLIYFIPLRVFYGVSGLFEMAIAAVGLLFFWEILAELYVISKTRNYFKIYAEKKPICAPVFWIFLTLFSAIPFVIL